MQNKRFACVLFATVLAGAAAPPPRALPVAVPNDNRVAAGSLVRGVLSISLEARLTLWHPDGDSLPGVPIEAFGQAGRAPTAPGPLLRVPAGTELRISLRNRLERDTLTFFLPASLQGANQWTASDSIVVPPAEVRELRVRAARPGNYVYRAAGRSSLDRVFRIRGLLGGALIVDSAGRAPPRDRVLVLLDGVDAARDGVPDQERELVAINGRSWPHTERLRAREGDTLRWRVLNASPGVHPMHLHGHYFRVDAFEGPPQPGESPVGQLAVTHRMTPFTTLSLSWVAERPGNWLFHCHFQVHAEPHRPLGAGRSSRAELGKHGHTGMGGLVMGVEVRPRSRAAAGAAGPTRLLRLVAVRDSGFPDSLPSLRFRLEDPASSLRRETGPGISPPLELIRGVPVSIMVVNQLGEPLSVHWHGMELESYYDGVAGFAGLGRRLAPLIVAGDSFAARFTPPRSGTFIYHSHVNETRQHRAGLVGALIVRDEAPRDAGSEPIFLIKSARGSRQTGVLEVNGQSNPDTVVLRAGQRYRLRFIGMMVGNPNSLVTLTARPDSSLANLRDTLLVRWRPLAKDGAELFEQERGLRPAAQFISIGETYDFEFRPEARGELRIEVRPPGTGRLGVRVPVRVE